MPGSDNPKYVVIRWEDWQEAMAKVNRPDVQVLALTDAVVIRLQDVFAPPALDAYANSITVAIEMMQGLDDADPIKVKRLREIASYFHEQARISWETERKVPD